MSAFKWLAFTFGFVLIAVVYSILTEFVRPGIDVLNSLSTTQASSQGIAWYSQFWDWLPLILLLLLAFLIVVGVIVRRRSVVGR